MQRFQIDYAMQRVKLPDYIRQGPGLVVGILLGESVTVDVLKQGTKPYSAKLAEINVPFTVERRAGLYDRFTFKL